MMTNTNGDRRAGRTAGFTYMEALIALAVLVVTMTMALAFFVDFGATLNSESTRIATQQSTRFAIDDLTRVTRQIGYGIRRTDVYNPGVWQHAIVYGGSHVLVFNADIDDTVGALPSSQTVPLPTGPAYAGEGIGATTVGAETYVYTLDADASGTITAADRTDAEAGNFNPAAETENPYDFALFRRVYGFNGTDYGGDLEPLTGNLFTNATTDAKYPDDTTPEPLFTYLMSEDLNQDGILGPRECVNTALDTCPPSTTRSPVLYLWGDTDFDGQLSESEKAALRTLEVGSAAWAPNPTATSGSYNSTTLSAAVTAGTEYELRVADASVFGTGYLLRIDSGAGSEIVSVETVDTAATPDRVLLSEAVAKSHASGVTVTVDPNTLLRAVRAVKLTYTAMSEQRDSIAGVRLAGRGGGKGTRGLDYRVRPVRRTIRVINATTGASPGLADATESICPLKIVNNCSGTETEQSRRYVGVPGQQAPTFLVTDALDNPLSEIKVTLSQSNSAVGLLTSTTALSDSSGLATVGYALTGTLGTDTLTGTVSCIDGTGTTYTASATNEMTALQLNRSLDADCLSTISSRTPAPASNFSIEVLSGSGPVSGEKIELGLQLDPLYMADAATFTSVVGGLTVAGSPAGSTSADEGELAPIEFTTDVNGLIEGSFGLTADAGGDGARLSLVTQIPQQECASAATSFNQKVDFFKLTLEPIEPVAECSVSSPCVISAGDNVPEIQAELSLAGDPVKNAPLNFTVTEEFADGNYVPIPPGVKSPEVRLVPASGVVSDVNGLGTTKVSNNGSVVITPATSLEALVDVESSGPAGQCVNGAIVSSSDEVLFDFETPMSLCQTEMLQAYAVKRANDKLCLHVKNANDSSTGCPQVIKGVQISMYLADGVTLDPAAGAMVKEIKGGAVSTTAACSSTAAVQLFKDDCQSPKRILNNGEAWMFRTFGSCKLPPSPIQPDELFNLHEIRFNGNFVSGNQMDVTVFYECTDECDGGGLDSETYRLVIP